MTKMVEVTQEDANNYCRVLAALGMEEEGDPVAEIESMRKALAEMSVEQESFRKDAKRYLYAKARNPSALCAIAWGVKAACAFDEPDAAMDAAMAVGAA